jgi:hypothetical protein
MASSLAWSGTIGKIRRASSGLVGFGSAVRRHDAAFQDSAQARATSSAGLDSDMLQSQTQPL